MAVTRLIPSATPGRLYGSFAGKTEEVFVSTAEDRDEYQIIQAANQPQIHAHFILIKNSLFLEQVELVADTHDVAFTIVYREVPSGTS